MHCFVLLLLLVFVVTSFFYFIARPWAIYIDPTFFLLPSSRVPTLPMHYAQCDTHDTRKPLVHHPRRTLPFL